MKNEAIRHIWTVVFGCVLVCLCSGACRSKREVVQVEQIKTRNVVSVNEERKDTATATTMQIECGELLVSDTDTSQYSLQYDSLGRVAEVRRIRSRQAFARYSRVGADSIAVSLVESVGVRDTSEYVSDVVATAKETTPCVVSKGDVKRLIAVLMVVCIIAFFVRKWKK